MASGTGSLPVEGELDVVAFVISLSMLAEGLPRVQPEGRSHAPSLLVSPRRPCGTKKKADAHGDINDGKAGDHWRSEVACGSRETVDSGTRVTGTRK